MNAQSRWWRWLLIPLVIVGLVSACGEWVEEPYLDEGYDDEWYFEDDEYYELPEDCFEDEVYDEVDRLCYPAVDCEGEDCWAWEEEGDLIDLFFGFVEGLLTGQDAESEDFNFGEEGEEILVTYQIEGNRLTAPEEASLSDPSLAAYQQDTSTHLKIWDYFADMIPQQNRTYLSEFVIFTDGVDGSMAAVEQDDDSPREWVLAVDIADAGEPEELTYTLIHEYGHLLTLNPSQVEPDTEIYYNPDDEDAYAEAAESCPRYFPGEGCSNSGAYIDIFFERFWTELYDEWLDINAIEDDDEYYTALEDFYYDYESRFVTDYAATNPEEDIAESWTYFVLKPRPDGDTEAEQKVLFFYEWDELVRLRAQIVSRTYSRLRRR